MKNEILGKYFAILGLILFWGPLWGIADSYFIMDSSFQEITLFGVNETKISREEMSLAAKYSAIGFLLFVLAIVLLAVSIMVLNYRKYWVFRLLIVYSILLIILLPLLTLLGGVGIVGLTLLILNRNKFSESNHVTIQCIQSEK